jgi:hypothetical protein
LIGSGSARGVASHEGLDHCFGYFHAVWRPSNLDQPAGHVQSTTYICAFAALGYRVHFTAVAAAVPDSLAWICLVYFDVSARCRTDLVNVATAWHMAQHIHICKQPAFALHLNILST